MKKIRKGLLMPEGLLKEVEEYMAKNHIETFTSAVFELIRKGLKA